MIEHAKFSEICEEVKLMKLQGLTIPRICHKLARKYSSPLHQKGNWQSNHVIKIFDYLRDEGQLPKNQLRFRYPFARKRK